MKKINVTSEIKKEDTPNTKILLRKYDSIFCLLYDKASKKPEIVINKILINSSKDSLKENIGALKTKESIKK